jgi:putative transposase
LAVTLVIVQPDTVIAWHRNGFRLFWTWKVRGGRRGRPSVPRDVRELIRQMRRENPLWGAPRIHGELLKLGIDIGETSVGKYMGRREKPPSQTWRTFLNNHLTTIVSIDFFTVPTIRFHVLSVFLILAHDRRRILHVGVTAHPTAEWTAQQLREAFPWESVPRYLLRDRDGIFGNDFVDQVTAMGMSQVLSTPGSPWQRAYIERVIGSIRRECLDHVIVSNERSPRLYLSRYVAYYHQSRTHLGLHKDRDGELFITSRQGGWIRTLVPLKLDRDTRCDAPERDVLFVERCAPAGLERAANVANVAPDAHATAQWEQDPRPHVAGR